MDRKISDKVWTDIAALANSPEARVLKKLRPGAAGKSLENCKKKIAEFIRVAKGSGLPSHLWMVYKDNGNLINISWLFVKKNAGLELMRECLSLGATCWSMTAGLEPGAYWFSVVPSGQSKQWIAASQKLCDLWTDNRSLAHQAFNAELLTLALQKDPLMDEEFFKMFIQSYERAIEGSGRHTLGILNAADQSALNWTSMILKEESSFLARSKDPLFSGEKTEKKVEKLIKDAKERFKAKTTEISDDISPEKLRESLTDKQRSRLKIIHTIIAEAPEDEELLLATLELTTFLKEKPSLASIQTEEYGNSLLSSAISCGCPCVIQKLGEWGANIWLASNQDDELNPVKWACDLKRYGYAEQPQDDILEPIARLILQGAELSGLKKPKDKCMTLVKEYIKQIETDYGDDYFSDDNNPIVDARKLGALMEKITLEEIINRPKAQDSPKDSSLPNANAEGGSEPSIEEKKTTRRL